MWPHVDAGEVEDRYRPLTDAEKTVADTRIDDVEAELHSELRLYGITGTPVVGSPGYPTPEAVEEWSTLYISVVARIVKDSLRGDPEGWIEESVQLDDYTRTRRRDKAAATGLVYVTADDVARLLPRVRPTRRAFSIRTT